MGCLGVLFSLNKEEVDKLKSFSSDDKRLEFLQEDLETKYFECYSDRIAELDKAWDAIHRSLTDGNLAWDNGTYPLNHVILGGEILYSGNDYIMSMKTPEQVKEIASSLKLITQEGLKVKYNKINVNEYGELSEEDFNYTWEWLENSFTFWEKAAEEQRYVLFTADQ